MGLVFGKTSNNTFFSNFENGIVFVQAYIATACLAIIIERGCQLYYMAWWVLDKIPDIHKKIWKHLFSLKKTTFFGREYLVGDPFDLSSKIIHKTNLVFTLKLKWKDNQKTRELRHNCCFVEFCQEREWER